MPTGSLVTCKGRRKEGRNRVSCRGKVHCIYWTALDKAEQRRLLLDLYLHVISRQRQENSSLDLGPTLVGLVRN